MIIGHYVTALFARHKLPNASLGLLLFSTVFLDVLWLTFVFFGFEKLEPDSWLHASFENLVVAMPYSHDLVPVLGWIIVMFLLGFILSGRFMVSVWCALLVALHWLCDLLVGFKHFMIDSDPPEFGLDLYHAHPIIAILLEAAFCGLCVAWYSYIRKREGKELSRVNTILLYALFVGGALATLPFAVMTLANWLWMMGVTV